MGEMHSERERLEREDERRGLAEKKQSPAWVLPKQKRCKLIPIGALYLAELSEGSRASVRSRLERAAAILGCEGEAPWHALTYEHVTLLRTVVAEKYKPSTARGILYAVLGACAVAWRSGRMPDETYRRIKAVKPIKGESLQVGRMVSRMELRDMFRACGDGPAGKRDRALLGLLFGAGLRRGEVRGLDLADFKDDRIDVRHAKNKQERSVPLDSAAPILIREWIAVRGKEDGPLLCAVRKGGRVTLDRISGEAIRKRLLFIAKNAGVKPFRPHDARRTYASLMLEHTDVAVVSRMLGHNSVNVTASYDRRGEVAEVEAAGRMSLPAF